MRWTLQANYPAQVLDPKKNFRNRHSITRKPKTSCRNKTIEIIWLGLFVLVASTIIVGYGNYLGGSSAGH